MIRDTRKTQEYFNEYIAYQKERITKFSSLKSSLDGAKVVQCNEMIAHFMKDLFVAMYSANASQDELKETFNEYLAMVKGVSQLSYSECVDIVAICIMLDISIDSLSDIKAFDDETDDLIKLLIGLDDLTGDLKFPEYYKPFYEYLMQKSTYEDFVGYVENEWYNSSEDFYWFDSHKNENDTYTGYWCWLAAACLKITKASNPDRSAFIPIF